MPSTAAPVSAASPRRWASKGEPSERHSASMKAATASEMAVNETGRPGNASANIASYSGIARTRAAIRSHAPPSPVMRPMRTAFETSFSP